MKNLLCTALLCLGMVLSSVNVRGQATFDPAEHTTFTTDRPDGRYVGSRAIAHKLMENREPRLKFNPSMSASEMESWCADVASTMKRLMNYPACDTVTAPVLTGSWQRDGYRIERWEAYPFDMAVVPYLVLVPDGVDASAPAPAILCIPGFGQTKELLAGESSCDLSVSEPKITMNAVA